MHAATRSDIARIALDLGVEQLEEYVRAQQGAADEEVADLLRRVPDE
jgi:hypothetical protein